MITISLVMIVKNEERVLKRCLDSVQDLVEELIIVDTGSTDGTKAIAASYGKAKVYDFEWIDDFAAARNYAFSLASCDYIYSCDADEVLDEVNRERFRTVKAAMLPEIDIVQMKYGNQLQYNTVYNYDEEYRPKLFKRIRTFTWVDPIHETVQTQPVIFDSDIVITHLPENLHSGRDLAVFRKMREQGKPISSRLLDLYARELWIAGSAEEFAESIPFWQATCEEPERTGDEVVAACTVLAAAARRNGDKEVFFKYAMRVMASGGNSEICSELGDYYRESGDPEEACMWYYNACFETKPVLCLASGGKETALKLADLYESMGLLDMANQYRTMNFE